MEKAKAVFIQNQLAMTRGILFHKGQLRPTPSGSVAGQLWKPEHRNAEWK